MSVNLLANKHILIPVPVIKSSKMFKTKVSSRIVFWFIRFSTFDGFRAYK